MSQVPPLPGPSHGKPKPICILSGTMAVPLESKEPFNKIKTVVWIPNAKAWWISKSVSDIDKKACDTFELGENSETLRDSLTFC